MRYKTLARIPEWFTNALLILAAVAGLFVVVLDFWGVDFTNGPWKWFKGPKPITLLIVALLALSLGLERLLFFRRIEEKLDEIDAKISGEIDTNRLRKIFDKNLVKVFGKRVSHLLTQIETAKQEKTITLEGQDDIGHWFPLFYSETLKAYPKSCFVATSLPYLQFFWKHDQVLEDIKRFTAQGSMERIFLLTRGSDVNKVEVRNVLDKQLECGVQVYVTDISKFPEHLKDKANEVVLVDCDENIAWHAEVKDRKILKVKATADKAQIKKYKAVFDDIKNLRGTKPYLQTAVPGKSPAPPGDAKRNEETTPPPPALVKEET